jgi:hypothetical protein
VETYEGDEGLAAAAQLLSPQAVEVDNYGSMYIADTGNSVIRNVDTSHTIHTPCRQRYRRRRRRWQSGQRE